MINITQMTPSSSVSASNYRAAHNPTVMNHHLESNQANNLGYGLGRWLGMAIDKIGNTWDKWWNTPSAEQLSKQRQIKIIRHQIKQLIPELTAALNKIPKNSKDPRALNWALKRIQTIVSDKMSLLEPNEDEELRDYQTKQFKPLEERISKLPSFVKDKLRALIPILFQNMENAEKGINGEEKKIGLNPQRISEFNHERESDRDHRSSLHQHHTGRSLFPASFNLANLNGANGFILNGINSNDQSGWSVASAGDVNGDGIGDLIIGAYNAAPVSQSYVIFGSKSSWSSPIILSSLNGNNGFTINGISFDQSGWSVASAGDVNGDGIGDLIVGAPFASGAAGQSYVIFGSKSSWSSPFSLSSLNGANGFILNGINVNDKSGWSVASAGDVNGDGIGDLIVGAPFASGTIQSYVVFGSKSSWSSPISLSSLNGNNGFTIINGNTLSSWSVASAGDVNGDGISDLIVGNPPASPGGNSIAGQSYVVFGSKSSWSSPFSLSSLNGNNGFTINGTNVGDQSGNSVASAGDVNGDGIDDLIVGAPFASSIAGQSYVVFGSKSSWSSSISLSSLNGANGFILNGISGGGQSGNSVASAGDVNGDGINDLIVGAPLASSGAGQSYVVFGSKNPWSSPISLLSLNGNNGFTINGINADDRSGYSVASAGDVNGDGIGDLIVGAPVHSSFAGQSYVVFGQNTSTSSSTTNLTTTPTTTPPGSSINIGAIVGGVLGVTILVAAAATVVASKVLKKGCFAEKTTATPHRMNHQAVFSDENL